MAGLVRRIAIRQLRPLGTGAYPANPSLDPEDAIEYLSGSRLGRPLPSDRRLLGISGARMFHCLSLRSIRLFYAPVITP